MTGDGATVAVVMGVSGSGKTTVGAAVAQRLGWDFADGDDLHPVANVAKMAAGRPLDDANRAPWLARVAAWVRAHVEAGEPGVITCSALKRSYRDQLRGDGVRFVFLAGSRALLAARLARRPGHFVPASLLDSQLAALEEPGPDEHCLRIDIGDPPDVQAHRIITGLGVTSGRPLH